MTLSAKSIEALNTLDRMPPALRECVHEFGMPIVNICLSFGIKKPAHIRELVKEIWGGARQVGQTGGARNTLDWILSRADGVISSKTLNRILAQHNMVIIPVEPTRAMLDASMAEVSGFNVRCTREEKHRRRLHAAAQAAMNEAI